MMHNGWWAHGHDGLSVLVSEVGFSSRPRVAVVASSGNLLFRGYGADIDSHDIVIRVNAPFTRGYEADVGKTTHMRFVWGSESWGSFADAIHRGVLTAQETTVFTQTHIGYSSSIVDKPLIRSLHRALAISNAWVASLAHETLGCADCVPSTGFQALAFAVAMAQLVGAPPPTAYGFGVCTPCVKYYGACARSQCAWIETRKGLTPGKQWIRPRTPRLTHSNVQAHAPPLAFSPRSPLLSYLP